MKYDLESLERLLSKMGLDVEPGVYELRCEKCGGFVKNLSKSGNERRIKKGIEECCGEAMKLVTVKYPNVDPAWKKWL